MSNIKLNLNLNKLIFNTNLTLISFYISYFLMYDFYDFFLIIIINFIFLLLINIFYSNIKLMYLILITTFSLITVYSSHYLYIAVQYNLSWKINLFSIKSGLDVFSFDFILYFDIISISFINLIFFITTLVMFYSINYFKNEQHILKLYLLLVLFCFSMCLLVLSYNWLFIFFGWELIGLTSFLLINFYNIKTGVLKSSLKAASLNRLSDFFLFSGIIILIIYKIDTINLTILTSVISVWDVKLAIILILLSSCIKSAQWGFHIWLPDSMEAPVPASSLIHSATLVSAGTYLILRLQPIIVMYLDIYTFFFTWFGITALLGAYTCSKQTDIKKLLAYSTISHCGFLCASALSGYTIITILYLYLHGIFKAFSFMSAGSFIQTFCTQDMRYMSQGYTILPAESFCLIFSLFNLSALPGSLGSYYKIFFLDNLLLNNNINYSISSFFFLASLFSISYFTQVFKHILFYEIKWIKPVTTKIINNKNLKTNQGFYYFIIFIIIIFFYIKFFFIFNYLNIEYYNSYTLLWKSFYSIVIIYIYYSFYVNNLKKKNYNIQLYLLSIILGIIIYWEALIIYETLTSILVLHIIYPML